jgi:hypothetical protein
MTLASSAKWRSARCIVAHFVVVVFSRLISWTCRSLLCSNAARSSSTLRETNDEFRGQSDTMTTSRRLANKLRQRDRTGIVIYFHLFYSLHFAALIVALLFESLPQSASADPFFVRVFRVCAARAAARAQIGGCSWSVSCLSRSSRSALSSREWSGPCGRSSPRRRRRLNLAARPLIPLQERLL